MKNSNISVLSIVQGGVIAALYVALTGLFQPIAFGAVQVRISEALCACALFSFSAVPGLTVGCVIANLLWSPYGLLDVLLGATATLVGTYLIYLLRNGNKYIALAPPVITNAFLVPVVLMVGAKESYWLSFIYILAGQAIACIGLGSVVEGILQRVPLMGKGRD